MKQAAFEARHAPHWQHFEQLLAANARGRRSALAKSINDANFAAEYRRLCQQLALAEKRGYSVLLIGRLRELVHRGHWQLYRPPPLRWRAAFDFFASEFPQLVRRHFVAMWLSAALFFVPLIALILVLQWRPEWIHHFLDAATITQFEQMYASDPASERLGRDSGTDLMMFGYYVMNNISIGFRTFASGLLLGLGPLLVLVSNATGIGSVAGYLTHAGYGDTFWRFVVGHSAPELIAIALAGGAGLQLGFAVIAPGRLSRLRALMQAGVDGGKLAVGVFALLLIAAVIEAFFSSMKWIPDLIRFPFGIGLWPLILCWLMLGGRDRAP